MMESMKGDVLMDYIITTEQLTKKYKNFTSVNHVSLHIRKGSIYGFLGPNGAGKSTTMKMLLGLTAPTKGSFTIDGKQFSILSVGFWDCRKVLWRTHWTLWA